MTHEVQFLIHFIWKKLLSIRLVLSAEPKYCEPECENATAAFGILFVTFLVAYEHEFDHNNDAPLPGYLYI